MIVVSAKDLTKAYGTDVILDKVSFHINKGDRVGIIGINGAGKTTLLKMLTGELACEEGDAFISNDLQIGYLKQDAGFDSEKTVIEEVNAVFDHFPEMEKQMTELLQKAAELAKLKEYHTSAYPNEPSWLDALLDIAGDKSYLDEQMEATLGEYYEPFKLVKSLNRQSAIQARLPFYMTVK